MKLQYSNIYLYLILLHFFLCPPILLIITMGTEGIVLRRMLSYSRFSVIVPTFYKFPCVVQLDVS